MGRAADFTPGGYVYGRIVAGATEGVRLGAQQVLTTSRQRVPIEEGTLERSGTVSAGSSTLPRVENGSIVAAITYDTPYAARQHEELGNRHDDGRQAKYLESAMGDDADTVRALIAQAIRNELTRR